MSNFVIFVVGVAVTLIAGMGVLTSQVFIAYNYEKSRKPSELAKASTN